MSQFEERWLNNELCDLLMAQAKKLLTLSDWVPLWLNTNELQKIIGPKCGRKLCAQPNFQRINGKLQRELWKKPTIFNYKGIYLIKMQTNLPS